jgi:hypothetical protein
MSVGEEGYHKDGEWFCIECEFYCDTANYNDIQHHEWLHEGGDATGHPIEPQPADWFTPPPRDKCETCGNWIRFKDDHDWSLHDAHEGTLHQGEYVIPEQIRLIEGWADRMVEKVKQHQAEEKPPPKMRAVLTIMNYIRMNDDLLETTSAFLEEDGNVIISGAWFKTLMGEAGWQARK